MLVLLVGTGVFLTFRTGWVQVRWFGYIMKNTVGSLFRKRNTQDHGSNLSPFQAVTTALAGTVGTGNIAGVTGAIFIGGPGGPCSGCGCPPSSACAPNTPRLPWP